MTTTVTILGTGLMGSALATAFLDAGTHVSVWNRNAARCDPLRERGANVLGLQQAIGFSELVIVNVLDYASATSLFDEMSTLHGKVVVNLVTGNPADAERFGAMITGLGGRYLDGAIEAYPEDIGSENALIHYDGDQSAWVQHRSALKTLAGNSIYLGERLGSANVMDATMTGAFHTVGICAFLEAAAYARSNGIDPAELDKTIDYWTSLLGHHLHLAVKSMISGDYTTDQATLSVYRSAMDTWEQGMIAGGQPANLVSAAARALASAEDKGHGAQAIYVLSATGDEA